MELKGSVNNKNRNYYNRLFPTAKEVIVSDYCPSDPGHKPSSVGYKLLTEQEEREFDFSEKSIWYRRATSNGKHKLYVKL